MKKKKLLKIIEEFKHDLEDLLEMNKYNSDPTFDVIEGFQRVKYCKECKLKQELTPAYEVISLDENIFDIKATPRIEVKRFSNLVERV